MTNMVWLVTPTVTLADGIETTYSNTTVNAGNAVSITSRGDTQLACAKATCTGLNSQLKGWLGNYSSCGSVPCASNHKALTTASSTAIAMPKVHVKYHILNSFQFLVQ
jgi:hypothetical protein